MNNALPARYIEAGGTFSAVRGSGESPIIFTVGTNHRLYIIQQDPVHNENVDLDLSKAFSLPDSHTIHSLAVTQDFSLTIHIAFASGPPNGQSDLRVVKPVTCQQVTTWNSSSNLTSWLLNGQSKQIHIEKICLGDSAQALDNSPCPPIFVQYRNLSQSTFDFCPIIVEPSGTKWTFSDNLQSPINADSILSLRAATISGSRSLFALTREVGANKSSTLRLLSLFESGGTLTLQDIPQRCPREATCLSTCTNADGNDDLLIAGGGLHYLKGADCILGQQGPDLRILSTEIQYQSPNQFHTAHESEQISIWIQSAKQDVCYQEYQRLAGQYPQAAAPVIPLLLQKAGGGNFAPIRAPGGVQQLLVIGKKDAQPVLTMLSQNLSTRLWQSSPISVPDLDEMVQFVSYTSRIELKDSEGIPVREKEMFILTSIPTELIVNGTRIVTDKSGKLIATDNAGTVTIILPGDKTSPPTNCPLITLTPVAGSSNTSKASDLVINPTAKISDAATKLASIDELKKLKAKGMIGSDVSEDQLQKAADAFGGLKEAASSLSAQQEKQASNPANSHAPAVLKSQQISARSLASGIANVFDDFWTLIKKGFNDIVSWGIQKVKDGWAFVIELADGVYHLVVKTISHIAEAVIKVFDFIKMGIEKIIEFIGFLFRWDDIVKTKNVFVNLVTQGLIWGSDNLVVLQNSSDKFFDDMKSMVQDLKTKPLPSDLDNSKVGKDAAKRQSDENSDKTHQDELKSPGTSWGQYQMQHGGKTVNSQQSASKTSSIGDTISEIWDEVKHLMQRLTDNFSQLFGSSDKSIGELLKDMGIDLLTDIISVTGKMASKLIGLLSQLILQIADGINTEIKIPVLSALYKSISGGTPLTVIDSVCLVIAIPATVGYKLFMKQSPTEISGVDYLTKPNIYLGDLKKKLHPSNNVGTRLQAHSLVPQSRMKAISHPIVRVQAKHHGEAVGPAESGPQSDIDTQQKHSVIANTLSARTVSSHSGDKSQFDKDASVIDDLMYYGAPAAALLWFDIITRSKWYIPDTGPPTNDIALVTDLVIWFLQANRVGGSGIAGFGWRMSTWLIGLIGVVANECGKTVRCGLKFWSCVFQLLTSIANYVTLFSNDIDVDIYSMIEDLVVVVGDMLANSADGTNGASLEIVISAIIMKNAGYIMRMAKKDRKGYRSGMDLKT